MHALHLKAINKHLVFTFDLEKNPVIAIHTDLCCLLWLYNLGVNTIHDNQGHVFLWLENEGRRGLEEICSTKFHFLNERSKSGVAEPSRMHSFSDCCSGQKRTIYFVSVVVLQPKQQRVDRDFGTIERKGKIQETSIP